jgi:NADPH:quinone reductase-like Zn-dependent oxidoreductase
MYHWSYLALGANVIAAAGSQAKLDICKKYGGADYCIDYTKKDWQKEVLKITGGKGVDVVYDPVGLIAGQSLHSQYIVKILSLLDRLS